LNFDDDDDWEDEEEDPEDEEFRYKCNPANETADLLDDNIDRCEGMPCDANYQCFTLNCNAALKCAPYETESKFTGILALIAFAILLMIIIAVAVIKLCLNRITPEILRERLAGAIKRTSKGWSGKRASRVFEEADFTVRKKTVRASRSGTTHFSINHSMNKAD
jgi:hypothetical protein